MKKSKKNRFLKIAAILFIFFLFIASNQANLRKSLAEKFLSFGNYNFNGGAYDLEKAENRYKLALFFDSKLPSAHYQLGRVYFVEGKFNEAREQIDTELSLYPDNLRPYYVRGLIDGYSADFEAAIDDFAKFNAWAPEEWAGYNDLAWAYYKNENYDKAEEVASKGLKLFPNNVWLLNGLGASQLSLEDFSLAQSTLNKVANLSDDMTANEWARAYPGNDPTDAQEKLEEFRNNVGTNLALAQNDISIGGFFADACASCLPTHYECAEGTLGDTAEYSDSWQWWCNSSHIEHPNVLCEEIKPVLCTPGDWDSARCRACNSLGLWDADCSNYGPNNATWCACNEICGGTCDPSCCPYNPSLPCCPIIPPACDSLPPNYAWCPEDIGQPASEPNELHIVDDLAHCTIPERCQCYPAHIPGDCGSANGGTYCQKPTNSLCSPASSPTVSANGNKWEWKCGSEDCFAFRSCAYQEVSPN